MVWDDEPRSVVGGRGYLVGLMLYRSSGQARNTAQRVARSLEQFVDLFVAQPATRIETLACAP